MFQSEITQLKKWVILVMEMDEIKTTKKKMLDAKSRKCFMRYLLYRIAYFETNLLCVV